MKILFVTSECAPFSKSGGLADVAYSLPPALKKAGNEVAIITPLYQCVRERFGKTLKKEKDELEKAGKSSKYKGFDKVLRICLRLSNYKPLEKPFVYGLDRNAAIGVALTRQEFKDYANSSKH